MRAQSSAPAAASPCSPSAQQPIRSPRENPSLHKLVKDDAALTLLDVLIRIAHPQCSPLILHSKLAALASGLLLYLTLRDDTQELSSLLVRASLPWLSS